MRIIETFSTVLDRNEPGRQFTLHVNEYELDDILIALSDVFDRDEEEMIVQIETALN